MDKEALDLRQRVVDTFNKYGGWWQVEGMADWLDADIKEIQRIYDELEAEGLMDRKGIMDKEAREEMAKVLHETHKKNCRRMFEWSMRNVPWDALDASARQLYRSSASVVLRTVEQLGYRKLPKGKPPLLSDKQMQEIEDSAGSEDWRMYELIAQAQREICVKHYEG